MPKKGENNFNILFKDIIEAWSNNVKLKVKESTFSKYKRLVICHIVPAIGELAFNQITTQAIEKYINTLLDSGRLDGNGGLSEKTANDILVIIKSIIKYAKSANYQINCSLDQITLKREEKEIRVFSKQEQNALIKVLVDNIDSVKAGVLLCLYTGLRIGELCALRWENIDLKEKMLYVKITMQRIQDVTENSVVKTKIVITSPKSESSLRNIPLPDFIIDLIKPFVANPKAYFLTGDKNRFLEPRTVQYRFKSYLKSARIENAGFHSIRHTFATRCVELGFEIKSLSEILGHANVTITLDRYVHSSSELKRENMDKLKFERLY